MRPDPLRRRQRLQGPERLQERDQSPARARTPARARASSTPSSLARMHRAQVEVIARCSYCAIGRRASRDDRGRPHLSRSRIRRHVCCTRVDFGLGLRPEHYEEIAANPGQGELVRGAVGELHGAGRRTAALARPLPARLSDGAARRVAVDRLDRSARPPLPRRTEGAGRPGAADVGFRPSLLHRTARPEHARPAAAALHRGGAGPRRASA